MNSTNVKTCCVMAIASTWDKIAKSHLGPIQVFRSPRDRILIDSFNISISKQTLIQYWGNSNDPKASHSNTLPWVQEVEIQSRGNLLDLNGSLINLSPRDGGKEFPCLPQDEISKDSTHSTSLERITHQDKHFSNLIQSNSLILDTNNNQFNHSNPSDQVINQECFSTDPQFTNKGS